MSPSVILAIITAIAPLLQQLATSVAGIAPSLAGALMVLQPAAASQPVNLVALVQRLLNEAQAVGYISFGAPLVVDGQFGGRTFGAIKALQAKLGFAVQEPAASLEMEALAAIFAKL